MCRLLNTLLAACALLLSVPAALADASLDLSQYHGKVVYLDFWASWCKPCRHSFPWMNAMEKKYGADGLVIVAVDLDEQHADAVKFLQQVPADFTVVYDPEGKLAAQYAIIGMPSSFIIGRNGEVVQKHQGFFDDSPVKYEAELRQLLAQP